MKTNIAQEERDRAQVGIGAKDHDVAGFHADLEPDEWARFVEPPSLQTRLMHARALGIGSWKDTSWYAPGRSRKKGYERSWKTGPSWGHGWYKRSGRPWNSSKEVWFSADSGCRWCNVTGPRVTVNVVLTTGSLL